MPGIVSGMEAYQTLNLGESVRVRPHNLEIKMNCKNCQYNTLDGRCLYFAGCPYDKRKAEVRRNADGLDYFDSRRVIRNDNDKPIVT